MDRIPEGGGIMHHEFILRLWKSLLDDWFGVGANVFIVTPRIDSERLFTIMLLMIRNKGTGFHVRFLLCSVLSTLFLMLFFLPYNIT